MAPGAKDDTGQAVAAILLTEGRLLLAHRQTHRVSFPDCWDIPGGHVEDGESLGAALRRELKEELGVEAAVPTRPPDYRLAMPDYHLHVWVLRAWAGTVSNCSPEEHDSIGWFAADELAELELADPRYLSIFASLLAGGRARLSWSADGAIFTKSASPRVVVPQWAGLLGTPLRAAQNEMRVNRLLTTEPPPVRVPKLVSYSRRGPCMAFEAIKGPPLGPKFPSYLADDELDGILGIVKALDGYHPRRRWFRRLYVQRRLALHHRSGLVTGAQADILAELAGLRQVRWGFAHGDVTARNVLKAPTGERVLIDWEWAGLYPLGYDLAFLWFSLGQVPTGRDRARSAVPPHHEPAFLLSAALIVLLHLQLWLRTPNPFVAEHQETLKALMVEMGERRAPAGGSSRRAA